MATVLAAATAAEAGDEFPLVGTFMQGKPCKGDGTDARTLLVTITADEIKYRQGVCAISDKRQNGEKLMLNATCKTRSGNVMSGDVIFTRKDETTLEMVDQDGNYRTVLHKCPAAPEAQR